MRFMISVRVSNVGFFNFERPTKEQAEWIAMIHLDTPNTQYVAIHDRETGEWKKLYKNGGNQK